jgi:hypothetical protein
MAAATKQDIRRARAMAPTREKRGAASHSTMKTWPPLMRGSRQALPRDVSETPSRGRAASAEASELELERDDRLRAALGWHRFEAWCASHGLGPPPAPPEAIAVVALYMTFLAATRRSVTFVARALLRNRERKNEAQRGQTF